MSVHVNSSSELVRSSRFKSDPGHKGFVQIHMHTCCDEWNVRKHPAIQVNTVPQGLLGLPGRVLPGPPSH